MDVAGLKSFIVRFVAQFETQKQAAAKLGISQQHLSDILQDRRMPGDNVLKTLGLERRVYYVRIKA